MRSVLFLGTSSGAGKTTVDAMYCRYLFSKGIKVAPFKASNLSLNSYVTDKGEEIGMGQAFQAWACGIEPEGDMNPVLLKPSGGGKMQLVLRGKPFMDYTSDTGYDRKAVMEKVCGSYDRLCGEYDAVVCEGSGSPAELNLMDTDMANVGMMRARKIPAVLVADIERGGVFAAIYGTWLLLPDDVRPLMKGFIINRFRGDASILGSGIEKIESMTGMRCFGVIGYMDLRFPEEDSMSDNGGKIGDGDVHSEFLKNLDAFLDNAERSGLDLDAIYDISSA